MRAVVRAVLALGHLRLPQWSVVMFCVLLVSPAAPASTLEDLLSAERYAEFFAGAEPAASQGDAEAMFLLGKAAHLGKGTSIDLARAAQWYEKARALGSARASHNLGLIALDGGRRTEAVSFFEEALARGLKLPTLFNLGLALTPEEPRSVFDVDDAAAQAARAAQRFAEAYAERADATYAAAAGKQYLRVYLLHKMSGEGVSAAQLAENRAQAVQWLTKAMDAGDPFAWTNYGAMLLDERNYAEARRALERGAAGNNGVAHYHLARMAQAGEGDTSPDADLALLHYEKAALLGIESARGPALQLLETRYASETDLAELERGVARIAALRRDSDFEPFQDPAARLAWGKYLQENRPQLRAALGTGVRLNACGLGLNEEFGERFNVGEGTEWQLVAHVSLADIRVLEVRGVVDATGCAQSREPLAAVDRDVLREASVVTLRFPGPELPLVVVVDSTQQSTLRLAPLGAALPPR